MTNRCLLFLRAMRMTTPITMTTSTIKTTVVMTAITDVVVARSVRVGVDAVERKHNMEWHKEDKQGTQHRNMTVKKLIHITVTR